MQEEKERKEKEEKEEREKIEKEEKEINILVFIKIHLFGVQEKIKEKDYLTKLGPKMRLMKFTHLLGIK